MGPKRSGRSPDRARSSTPVWHLHFVVARLSKPGKRLVQRLCELETNISISNRQLKLHLHPHKDPPSWVSLSAKVRSTDSILPGRSLQYRPGHGPKAFGPGTGLERSGRSPDRARSSTLVWHLHSKPGLRRVSSVCCCDPGCLLLAGIYRRANDAGLIEQLRRYNFGIDIQIREELLVILADPAADNDQAREEQPVHLV